MRSLWLIFVGSIISCSHAYLQPQPTGTARYINLSLQVSDGSFPMLKTRQLPPVSSATEMRFSTDTVAAASTILISSTVGFASDKLELSKRDLGIMITLLTATMITNFGLFGVTVPSTHPVYDLCWSKFLPASLSLILFSASSGSVTENQEKEKASTKDSKRSLTTRELIVALGIPFVIGSLGSILGCLFSSSFLVWVGSVDFLKKISMSPIEASIAAGKGEHKQRKKTSHVVINQSFILSKSLNFKINFYKAVCVQVILAVQLIFSQQQE